MKTKERKKLTIVQKMLIAVVGGVIVGSAFLLLREYMTGHDQTTVWTWINNILFQDITKPEGVNAIGLLYIVSEMFMHGLQLAIVPLVLVSLSLAISSLSDPEKLGKIALKTIICFLSFYVIGATIAGCAAYFIQEQGWFDVALPASVAQETTTIEAYNPLTTLISAIPSNIGSAFSSNNSILAVVVVALIIGLCMSRLPEKTEPFKKVLESLNEIIQYFLNFLINKIGPYAIFCMITRTFAIYGIEYIKPTFVYIVSTIIVSLVIVSTIYPLGVYLTTRLNPFIFMKKVFKIGLFAAATNSSAATLPINMETCETELGCSEEISSFVLPTGMTINMNGTTCMHLMAVTFIAASAGIHVTPANLVLAAFLSICTAIGTPAIPVAGTTMVYVVLTGLGFSSDLVMIGYALVLAMNYIPGMAVITLNVIGDAATNVIVSYREGQLNRDIYNADN